MSTRRGVWILVLLFTGCFPRSSTDTIKDGVKRPAPFAKQAEEARR